MNKSLVQQQFGAHAAAYATSSVHAKGASLGRLVELVRPKPSWQAKLSLAPMFVTLANATFGILSTARLVV